MMRRLLSLLLLLCIAAPAAAGDFVRTEGRRFVGRDGQMLQIKGINLGNWLIPEGYMFKFVRARSPRQINDVVERLIGPDGARAFWQTFRDRYVTRDDIAFIKSVGFNTIRIPLHYALFVAGPPDAPRFEGEGYARLDAAIGWAKAEGLNVIVDLHAAPGGQTGVNHDDGPGLPLMFYVPAHRRLTIALWRHLAERYRDEPTVIGWDLLNEPITPYADMDYLNPRLEPFYRQLVAAIRAVDHNHIIFLAAAQWSLNFAVFGPPFADRLAYTYHKFWSSTRRDAIQPYLNFAHQYDVPLFLGESGELNDDWAREFRLLHDAHGLSWAFWTFKNLESNSTIASIARPPGWDKVMAVSETPPEDWSDAVVPGRAEAQAILDAYLDNLPLSRTRIQWSYLAALGLAHAPPR